MKLKPFESVTVTVLSPFCHFLGRMLNFSRWGQSLVRLFVGFFYLSLSHFLSFSPVFAHFGLFLPFFTMPFVSLCARFGQKVSFETKC